MVNLSQKEYPTEKIKNIILIGHGGSGKTTFSESILHTAGVTNRLGRVEDGSTISDYHHDEIERKISINSSLLHCEWNSFKINIIDTPGYSDFIGEVVGSLRVVDTAVLMLKAVEGVEINTESVWNLARTNNIPLIFVVNKLDNENAKFDDVVHMAKARFGSDLVIVQFPVNEGGNFDTYIDVLKMKMIRCPRNSHGKFTYEEIPEEYKSIAEKYHEELIEKIAETDEQLMNIFFEKGTLPDEELRRGLKLSYSNRNFFPIFCTAAGANVGAAPILDFIVDYVPSPKDRGAIRAINGNSGQEVNVQPDSSGHPSLFIFKTISEQHVGELSFFRVYSGTITAGLDLMNSTNNKTERLGQLFLMNGKERKEVTKLFAGDIGATVKLKDTHTNNTLCTKVHQIKYPTTIFPSPVIQVAIKSKAKGDEEKIANGLHSLHEEDPTLVVEVDGKLSQTLLSGQGELHLFIQTNRLKEKYGVEIELIEPKIPYKETIKAVVQDSEYKHKKQTGGRGQYGHVHLKIEPLPRGTGFEFEDAIVGGVVPGRFVPAVEKGVIDSMTRGVLAGYEVVDVKVTLFDGTYHTVDSDELSFKLAGSMAFKKGFLQAKPMILEPISEIEVTIPEDYMGDVMGDISGRRGKILGMESNGPFQTIKANVPMSELYKYSTILRSMTQGRGIFKSKFSHYDEAPREVVEKLTEARQKESAED